MRAIRPPMLAPGEEFDTYQVDARTPGSPTRASRSPSLQEEQITSGNCSKIRCEAIHKVSNAFSTSLFAERKGLTFRAAFDDSSE